MENLTYLCVFVKIFAKKLPLHDVQPLKQQLHLTFSFSYMPHIDFFDITLSQMAGECKTRREMAFTDIRLRKRDRRPQILAIPSVLLYNKLHGTKKPYPAHRCGTRNPFHPVFRLLAFLLRRRNRKGRHHTPCKIRGSVEVADDSMENLLILGAYTFRDAPGYGFTGYVWNGDGVDRIPFDKTEFIRADFRRNPVPDGRTLRAFRFRFLSGTI